MATAQQIASPGVYVTDSVGVEVTDGSNSRVQLGLLPTGGVGSYGLRVVGADGSTVIVDGTSDIFKISATGTYQLTVASGAAASVTTVLVGHAAPGTTRAHTGFVSSTSASNGNQYLSPLLGQVGGKFVAGVSAGSPTFAVNIADWIAEQYVSTSAVNGDVSIVMLGWNAAASSATFFARYYIYLESAF